MTLNINAAAIAAAAAALKMKNAKQASTAKAEATSHAKRKPRQAQASGKSTKPKASASTRTTVKPHVQCVTDPNMVSAITNYFYTRPDMLPKLANPKKTVEGCCQYIIGKMKKIAERQRNGASVVGLFRENSEIYGMAVHYFDEPDETLAKENEEGEK